MTLPRLLLLGANGQVGWELQRALAPLGKVIVPDRQAADLTRPDTLPDVVAQARPRVIINAAAYTAVDRAEAEPDQAGCINHRAPAVLATQARIYGALLVHYSTDYVFDGSGEHARDESAATGPLNVYGSSKLAGEQAIAASGAAALVLRTSWVFGRHGLNFVKSILRLATERDALRVVDDQIGAPTPAELIADATAHAVAHHLHHGLPEGCRLRHLTAANPVSWCGFARAIVATATQAGYPGLLLDESGIAAIASSDYPTPAARPHNSRLDCRRFETDYGLTLPDWRPALERHLKEMRP